MEMLETSVRKINVLHLVLLLVTSEMPQVHRPGLQHAVRATGGAPPLFQFEHDQVLTQ